MKIKKRIPIITKKIVTAVIISGFFLCSVISFVGYRAFDNQFKKEYDFHVKAIAAAACETVNPDKFSEYLLTKTQDSEYEEVLKVLQDFVDKFELNLIYVSFVDGENYNHITYIYNPVSKTNPKFSVFPLGFEETYNEVNYNNSAKKVFENAETIVRHTLKTRSGSHITAMVPVFDSNQKVVAVLGVQKSIQSFVDAGNSYMKIVLLVELIFACAFVILFTFFISKQFIKPIFLITHETDHFASYGGEPSDNLLSIKNRDEIGILAHSVHQMEYDVCRNIKELTKLTAEKERISTELSVAAKIQSDMLPKEYPPFPARTDFDLFASMTPAKEVGGDLYDYLLLDEDHLMLTLGDVSGKGVPAALFMGKCKVLLDFYALLGLSPKEIFEKTNEQLCKGNESGLFVTCWLGIFTFSTGELRFVNAGHPYPILFHENDFSFLKEKPNLVLGGMEGFSYKEYSVKLNKGDRIFVYSDGVTEATDSKEQLFGDERLISTIKNTKDLNALETLSFVRSKIDLFVGKAEQFDDISMLQFVWKNKNEGDNSVMKELVIKALDENLDEVQNFVREQASSFSFDKKTMMKIAVAVEEIFVNITHYAYKDKTKLEEKNVKITTMTNESEKTFTVTFTDNGIPFNPLEKADPDTTLSAEDRDIGGLGIYITKKYMDDVQYKYEDGKNILTIKKCNGEKVKNA